MASSMMIVATKLPWLCNFICSAFATSPPSNSLSKPAYNLPTTLYQNLASELNTSSPQNAVLDIKCSGKHFGFNPSIVDCGAAKEIIIPDTAQHLFGERHTGLGDDVFPLPFRVMGDRGLCFFQALLVGDVVKTAQASFEQIRRAASALILQCAASGTGESTGGIASNIGGDNQLHVALGTYQPNVQCRGIIGPEWNSCKDILGDMPAGKARTTFGPRTDKSVQQGLPVNYNSEDQRCVLQIFSTGKSDISVWYRIWEAVTAVFSICIEKGKGGVFRGLGDSGDIFLTLGSNIKLQLPGNTSMESVA